MKAAFFPRLAWASIRRNKRLYIPYMLTVAGMVMMFYIIAALAELPVLSLISGGTNVRNVLTLGRYVMGAFAVLFLFYTNAFLMRRRQKEFGLYNILGMGKRSIGGILVWETLILYVLCVGVGLAAGVALAKLAELGLLNTVQAAVDYELRIEPRAIVTTLVLFAAIFVLILVSALRRLRLSNPIELLRSESHGEKPPKANWLLAVVGVFLLGFAYYLAVTIQSPMDALLWFTAAVILVIVATYLLFIAGSVTLCRLLQKNKRYYYRTKHFVSVSSMAFRMKRNGAGLASVCILCTMVLVMITSTTSLYIGADDSLHNRYPRDLFAEVDFADAASESDENLAALRELIADAAAEAGVAAANVYDCRTASISGLLEGDRLESDVAVVDTLVASYKDVITVYLVPLADYCRMTGAEAQLAPGEALLYPVRMSYSADTLALGDALTLEIRGVLDDFPVTPDASMQLLSSLFVVVSDLPSATEPLAGLTDGYGAPMLRCQWNYGFDTDADETAQVAARSAIEDALDTVKADGTRGVDHSLVDSLAANRSDFYTTYGGLFFLGILLSIVFLFAAVLILYYKQICEGYEDQSRFQIMRNVGMTKQDIRRGINSQILTVFFAPLVSAGLHLGFAFPLVWKLLMLFNLRNMGLAAAVNAGCFLLFALFYTLVYRLTSNAYYGIVSGGRERAA